MANIRVDVDYTIADGAELLFYAPCDFANISGLKVYYPGADAGIVSHEFTFQDAHKNDLSNLDNLFAEGACVKVILSLTNSTAYIQNAVTNAYLEGRFDKFVDGTTQVGNAKTLDGHGAEYFAKAEQVSGTAVLKTSILEHALTLERGVYEYYLGGSSYVGNDLPHGNYAYGNATIYKREAKYITVVLWGLNGVNDTTATNTYRDSAWTGWRINATTADLAKYLPLDGSVPLDRLLTVGTSNTDKYVALLLKNLNRSLEFGITQAGAIQLHDATNKKNIFTSGADGTTTFYGHASGNLPLTGGTLTKGSIISFEKQDNSTLSGNLGMGFFGDVFELWERGGSNRGIKLDLTKCGVTNGSEFIHTGNKPTGTYTGNGDATERTINTGGIGNMCLIYAGSYAVIATPSGAFRLNGDAVLGMLSANCKFVNGVLTIADASAYVNTNGWTYNYQVL